MTTAQLSTAQLDALGEILRDCIEAVDLVERINERIFNAALDIRSVPNFNFFLTKNDISKIMQASLNAERLNREAAMDRLKA
jgi:hypothetical protein